MHLWLSIKLLKVRRIHQFLTDKAVVTLVPSVVTSRHDYCNSVCVH